VEDLRGQDGITLWESPFGLFNGWLNLNHRINGWAPIRESTGVRRAFANLFDSETVIEEIYRGNANRTATFHPEWGPYYPPEDDLFVAEGTVERAKELLQSGTSTDYGYDGDDAFVGPDGTQVELTGVRPIGNTEIELEAQYTEFRLSDAGIALDLQAESWSSVLSDYAANSVDNVDGVDQADWVVGYFNGGPWNQSASAEEWDLMFGHGFEVAPYTPWSTVESVAAARGTFNLWGIDLEGMDLSSTLTEASRASDPDTTRRLTTDAFAFLSEKTPLVWSRTDVEFVGYTDGVTYFPGEARDWGARAETFFERPDPARLLRRDADRVATETTDAEEDDDADDGDDDTESDVDLSEDVPGFGPLSAAAGVGGLLEVARRRRSDDGDDEP